MIRKVIGPFVTVEGGEGVGKSTFIQRLNERLVNKIGSSKVLLTREPGGSPSADLMRSIFVMPPAEDPLVPHAELLLVNAARAQHLQSKVFPALRQGRLVLCDRFADSTRVYQGVLTHIDPKFVEAAIGIASFGQDPDLTFLLDCDPNLSVERLVKRSTQSTQEVTRFDKAKIEQHTLVRKAFLQLAEKYSDRFVVLDASKSVESLVDHSLDVIQRLFSEFFKNISQESIN